jgi:hypothetical protein
MAHIQVPEGAPGILGPSRIVMAAYVCYRATTVGAIKK